MLARLFVTSTCEYCHGQIETIDLAGHEWSHTDRYLDDWHYPEPPKEA